MFSFVYQNTFWLPDSIKKLETAGLTLQEAMGITEEPVNKLNAVQGEVGDKVSTKLNAVLNRNPGYSTLHTVCHTYNSETVKSVENILPSMIPLHKYALVMTCDVKRSFSIYKNILSDRRHSKTTDNIEKYLIINYASNKTLQGNKVNIINNNMGCSHKNVNYDIDMKVF